MVTEDLECPHSGGGGGPSRWVRSRFSHTALREGLGGEGEGLRAAGSRLSLSCPELD